MARKQEADELRGASNSLRGFLQTFRHAAELASKMDAALAADARLTQWEREEEAIKARIEEHRTAQAAVEETLATARDVLKVTQAQIDERRARLRDLDAEVQAGLTPRLEAADAELAAKRAAHEADLEGLRETIAAAEAELAGLREQARRIREHFAGAPA